MIYSPYEVYPREADELPGEPVTCYTCNCDCPGAELISHNASDLYDNPNHVNYEVNRLLVIERGYWEVNYDHHSMVNGDPCLKMYRDECRNHFAPEMKKLGYETVIKNIPNRRAVIMCFIYKDGTLIDPKELLPVFEKVTVMNPERAEVIL